MRNEIELGIGQWWATVGSAILAVGLILGAMAFSAQQVIYSMPANYQAALGSISTNGFNIGAVAVVVGILFLIYSRYKIAVSDK